MAKMAHAATLPASTFLFVDEALSLDHRGWKAAPTEKYRTRFEGKSNCGASHRACGRIIS
jgi:hypothetical protein